jgi:hypothetical protein
MRMIFRKLYFKPYKFYNINFDPSDWSIEKIIKWNRKNQIILAQNIIYIIRDHIEAWTFREAWMKHW